MNDYEGLTHIIRLCKNLGRLITVLINKEQCTGTVTYTAQLVDTILLLMNINE